jgi:hypothetical protein
MLQSLSWFIGALQHITNLILFFFPVLLNADMFKTKIYMNNHWIVLFKVCVFFYVGW